MDAEQWVSLLSASSVLCGIVLTSLFLHLHFYKKQHPEKWEGIPFVYTRWISKREKVRKEDLPSYFTYKEKYLTKKRFEAFLRKEKPFLCPDLKIMDITRPLRTNRRSLTIFIRRVYGINFEQCMNYWRLQELEQLQFWGPIRSPVALCVKVGFWSYRDYLRTKAEVEKRREAKCTKAKS